MGKPTSNPAHYHDVKIKFSSENDYKHKNEKNQENESIKSKKSKNIKKQFEMSKSKSTVILKKD